ncbi:SAM-dependent methyltransferase [Marinicella sp. W31]|uniref:SAM-dependent methyltransferase n=1 Tax=Marinicella sp. W31 TaxID=3023713 RepID=UPI0037580D8C
MEKQGSLVNVGLGMTLGAHISPISRNLIEQADVVFLLASNNLVEEWVKSMNDNVISLQTYYEEGQSRLTSYRQMVEVMLSEVRAGKAVCGAFYGHPGVFAWPPHESIRQALKEGYKAHMEPGISAEDCLYADLGIDPGSKGCQHYEASQLMFYEKNIDVSSYLVVWQFGLAGDRSLAMFSTPESYRQVFVDWLLTMYPEDHPVTIYECAVLPIDYPRIEQVPLAKLASQPVSIKTTIVLPPAKEQTPNEAIVKLLKNL